MIVHRSTFLVKQGAMDDLVAMMKEEAERISFPFTFRVYTPNIAPRHVLAAEWEFGSLDEYEKFWTDWSARPETAEFMEKWNQLTERGGTDEIWDLEA
jgi:hypothetical protein